RQLARTARVFDRTTHIVGSYQVGPTILPDYTGPIQPVHSHQIDLCAAIQVPKVGGFIPLVRRSLYLACAVDVIFLRHEEPFSLMRQGGDLDGRLKTLFDALKMPNPNDEYKGLTPTADPLYVVLEDDALISDFSIKSGRLLGRGTKK